MARRPSRSTVMVNEAAFKGRMVGTILLLEQRGVLCYYVRKLG